MLYQSLPLQLFDLEFVILGPSAQNLGYLVMSYVLWLHEALQNPDVNRSKLVKEAAVAYRNIGIVSPKHWTITN